MPKVRDIEVLGPRPASDDGFLKLSRRTACNVREDGSRSRPYPIDLIDRPSLDAVAVCAFSREGQTIRVLTRAGLRPAALFRRGKKTALPEREYLLVEELVAGVLEPGETGLAAILHRAAEELHEEAGIDLSVNRFSQLGGPIFMLPGIASEKIHLVVVEVEGPVPEGLFDAPGDGDGSPLEEGAQLRWRRLDEALLACETGEIEDAKTEVAFGRLARKVR